jgi:hypothetical protein
MRRPTKRAILFFILALGTGYTISWILMSWLLAAPLRLYGYVNLSLVALLIAALLLVWLDKPFELRLFDWPEERPVDEQKQPVAPEPESTETVAVADTKVRKGAMFPHEVPSEHWDIDYGDSKQTYQGADLPIWILAGWATFILWAVVYLVSGLPGSF